MLKRNWHAFSFCFNLWLYFYPLVFLAIFLLESSDLFTCSIIVRILLTICWWFSASCFSVLCISSIWQTDSKGWSDTGSVLLTNLLLVVWTFIRRHLFLLLVSFDVYYLNNQKFSLASWNYPILYQHCQIILPLHTLI